MVFIIENIALNPFQTNGFSGIISTKTRMKVCTATSTTRS